VTLWDVERGEPICNLEGLSETPQFLALLPDGKTALACDWSGLFRFYEIPTGRFLHELRMFTGHSLTNFVLSHDGHLAFAAGWADLKCGRFNVWDLAEGKLLQAIETERVALKAYGISSDHGLAVASTYRAKKDRRGSHDIRTTVFDIATGKVAKELPYSMYGLEHVTFAPDWKQVLVRNRYGYLALWDVETGKEIWEGELSTGSGRFMRGGRLILSEAQGPTWATVDAGTGKVLWSVTTDFGTVKGYDGKQYRCQTVGALSKDNRVYLAVGGVNLGDRFALTVKVWRVGQTAELVKTWVDRTKPEIATRRAFHQGGIPIQPGIEIQPKIPIEPTIHIQPGVQTGLTSEPSKVTDSSNLSDCRPLFIFLGGLDFPSAFEVCSSPAARRQYSLAIRSNPSVVDTSIARPGRRPPCENF
jgi:WD40 repeat protein